MKGLVCVSCADLVEGMVATAVESFVKKCGKIGKTMKDSPTPIWPNLHSIVFRSEIKACKSLGITRFY